MELTKIMTFCNNQKIKFKVLCNEIGVTDVEINTTPINNIATMPEILMMCLSKNRPKKKIWRH